MTILLTGSRAFDFWKCNKESNSDWDFIASEEEVNKLGLSFDGKDSIRWDNVEFLNREALNNEAFIGSNINSYFSVNNEFLFNYNICSIEELYIQKRSHVWRTQKFSRNIMQLEKLKEECLDLYECIPSLDNPILKDRIKLTKEKYGHRVPSLYKSNEDFFNDNVTKYYVHDDIHKVMAHYDIPLYEKMKQDFSLAKCEKDMWNQFSYEDKVKCVREECFVIALERFVIPKIENNESYMPARISFDKALEKVATNLTSNWFRDFAIDNFFEIRKFDVDFYSKFFNVVQSGELKKCLSTT
jgi:hypothetical protein